MFTWASSRGALASKNYQWRQINSGGRFVPYMDFGQHSSPIPPRFLTLLLFVRCRSFISNIFSCFSIKLVCVTHFSLFTSQNKYREKLQLESVLSWLSGSGWYAGWLDNNGNSGSRGKVCQAGITAIIRTKTQGWRGGGLVPGIRTVPHSGEKGLSDVQNIGQDKSLKQKKINLSNHQFFMNSFIPFYSDHEYRFYRACQIFSLLVQTKSPIGIKWRREWIFRFLGYRMHILSGCVCDPPSPTLIPANPHKTRGTNGAIMSPLWTSALIDLICQLQRLISCDTFNNTTITALPRNNANQASRHFLSDK